MDNVDDTDTYVLLSQPTSRFKLGLRVDTSGRPKIRFTQGFLVQVNASNRTTTWSIESIKHSFSYFFKPRYFFTDVDNQIYTS
jgi:hypothetical protein